MLLKKTKTRRKTITIIVAAALLLGAGSYTAIALARDMWPFNNNSDHIDHNPPSTEQREAGEEISQKAKEAIPEPEDEQHPKQSSATEGDGVSDTTIQITSIEQQEGQLRVRTLIHTIEPGNCTLKLTADEGVTITRSSDTHSIASTSTCKGFDIPLSELASGEWQIAIDYTSQHASGTVEDTVRIE